MSLAHAGSSNKLGSEFSMTSSIKGTRWSFGDKLAQSGGKFIFIPKESIGVKYKVVELLSV